MNPGERRLAAIDGARGLAIVLVATFHMSRALVKAHKVDYSLWLDYLDRLAYACHVQIFFVISGYFLFGRVRWDGALLRRSINLYYPYVIYSLATGLMLLALSGRANHEIAPRAVALIPVLPIQHYWFILFLIIAAALLALVRTRVEIMLGVLLALALTVYAYFPWVRWGPYQLGGLAYWLSFFFAGAVLRKRDLLPRASPPWFVVAVALALVAVWYSIESGVYTREPRFFPVSLALCYVLYCLGAWIEAGWLRRLGAASLVIYLTHIIFGSAARIAAYTVWPGAPAPLVFVFILSTAIIAPLVYARAAERLGLARLLGLEPIIADRARAPRPNASPATEP